MATEIIISPGQEPVIVDIPDPVEEPGPVPGTITPLQARKAMRQLDMYDTVTAYIATLPEEAQEEWEYASVIYRNHGLVSAGMAFLEFTDSQIDDLFRLGATL